MGTTNNIIVEGSLQHKFSIMVWGHCGQVLCIAPHPNDTVTFATGGASDRTVAKWRKQRVAWKLQLQSAVCSMAWHPNGRVVVAGTEEGNLVALNGESGKISVGISQEEMSICQLGSHQSRIRVCGSPITALGFADDGKTVAAAAENGNLYIFTSTSDGRSYKKVSKMGGGSELAHLDWNKTGDIIQTVSVDYR